jgi:hypothetical protein
MRESDHFQRIPNSPVKNIPYPHFMYGPLLVPVLPKSTTQFIFQSKNLGMNIMEKTVFVQS